MNIHIPIKLPSLLNVRMTWMAMAALKRKQRKYVKRVVRRWLNEGQTRRELPQPPLIVTITRIGPQKLDDDNLQGACKYVRDQIAAEVGVDDGSDLYTWTYKQRLGDYGVDIEITERL